MKKAVQWTYIFLKKINYVKILVDAEIRSRPDVPILKRVKLWTKGFRGQAALFYDFKKFGHDAYINDYRKHVKTPFINHPYQVLLNDKLLFHKMLSDHEAYLPKQYCLIMKGRVVPLSKEVNDIDELIKILKKKNLVLKPMKGGGGDGLIFIENKESEVFWNSKSLDEKELKRKIKGLDSYEVTELVDQAGYAAKVFPRTRNTMRVITMWDYQKMEPFIALAAHKFGSSRSYPADAMVRGGYLAEIDIETGKIGRALQMDSRNRISWYDLHEETKEKIEGISVKNWKLISSKIIEIAKGIPFIPYVGWDILATEDGFKIIEGNDHSGIDVFQIIKPFAKEERMREFFRRHGVI